MYNKGLTFKLRPGCYPTYKEAHDNLWPEIAESLAVNNVSMVIYLFGDRLFLHATAPTEDDWIKSREHPGVVKWNDTMATLIETDEQGHILFEDLEEAFTFGIFKAD